MSHPTRKSNKNIPIFAKSGLLSRGKIVNDIELKHSEPNDAIVPQEYFKLHYIEPHFRPLLKAKLRLCVGSNTSQLNEFDLGPKSSYLIGRVGKDPHTITDIQVPDPACSKQHCVIQWREVKGQLLPYLIDLESVNGTYLNGVLIPSRRYIELSSNDIISFTDNNQGGNDNNYEILFQQG